jgi:predicted transcriptional regulator
MPKKREGITLLNVEIPIELKKRIDKYCEEHGVKIKWLITQAIQAYLDSHQ